MAPEVRILGLPAAPETLPRLTVEGMTKSFNGRPAIEDVSFTVGEHEFVAVLGQSGAGKTTLFRCVAGLLAPDRGVALIADDRIAALRGRDRRRLAVIFQQFNLVSRLSAFDNVLAGRLGHVPAWRGWLRRFAREDCLLALECLDRVGLLAHAAQRADRLSGGQQQRVAIARALAQRAELIIADEPVASLDPGTSAQILDLLRNIARSDGIGVVCSLHQVPYAKAFADRIVGLSHGRVMLDVQAERFDRVGFEQLYGAPRSAVSPTLAAEAFTDSPDGGDAANSALKPMAFPPGTETRSEASTTVDERA